MVAGARALSTKKARLARLREASPVRFPLRCFRESRAGEGDSPGVNATWSETREVNAARIMRCARGVSTKKARTRENAGAGRIRAAFTTPSFSCRLARAGQAARSSAVAGRVSLIEQGPVLRVCDFNDLPGVK